MGLNALALEPRRLDVSRHSLGDPTGASVAVRLAVLTDLHIRAVGGVHEKLARAVSDAQPDIVLLVGDSVDRRDTLPVLGEFLSLLPDVGSRYATLGNWEYWSGVDTSALRRTYERGGTRLLVNESATLESGAVIHGLDDALAGQPDLSHLPDAGPVLLLSHCPGFRDVMPQQERGRIAAMVSGHTHGGQVAIGGWAPLTPPMSGAYVAGWYRGEGPDLFVSRGVGTSVIPVRLGSVPEVAIIDWHLRAV